jgi:hypothetical protein
MNIHIKTATETNGENLDETYDENALKRIVALLYKYDCVKHAYFMISADSVIAQFKAYAPEIPVCVGHDFSRPWSIVDRAIELGAEKVQLFKPYFNQEMIDKAHAHGIKCNVFWADDPKEARKYFEMGDLAGLIAPRILVVAAGREDDIFPLEGTKEAFNQAARLYLHAGVPQNCALVIGEGGHLNYADHLWQKLHEMGV